MNIVKNEHTVYFDVDGTLILPLRENPSFLRVDVLDPITKKYITYAVHEPMVRLLKEERHRGSHVVVWSRGGYEWAANVVRALDLVASVDQVMSKPLVYFDDLDVKEWLPHRVFLKPDCNYKK